MPEGHTIHRHATAHRRLFGGRPVKVSSPQGRFGAAAAVDGRVLEDVEAYGKHEFARFDNGLVVHVHLGLFGTWRTHRGPVPPEPRGQVRMRWVGEDATVDLSGPTACRVITTEEQDAIVARLGPDPIRRDHDPGAFHDRVAASRRAVGLLLMDQAVVAGVGNVYRAEALFVTGIHPEVPGRDLADAERAALWDTVVGMLRKGVRDGRIVTVDPAEVDLPPRRLTRDKATYVYKRDHCLRCATPVRRWDLCGRWCYACETCQPRR